MQKSAGGMIAALGALAMSIICADPAHAADPIPVQGGAASAALKIDFVRVPGGCMQMGSDRGEKHERPVHKACVSDFELGKYEVTQGQWKSVMGSNPSQFSACGDNCPVEMVSWNDAQEFIAALNARKIGVFRLPTEAEWEYACRDGGKDQIYAGKADASNVARLAWLKGFSNKQTHPVGGKEANALGLHDMSGNVWEWVQDTFATPYRTDLAELNPVLVEAGKERVLRGGSFDGKENYVRCAIRNRNDAGRQDRRLGLRLVREVAQR
jgi:formylglycine-generating enzyme required for sulfatase activity